MMKHLLSAGAALSVTFAAVSSMALTVSTTSDATVLANKVLGDGITLTSATYTGAASASGTFTNGGNIGISSGIILTTGAASIAVGPNNAPGATLANGTAGDAQLSAQAGGASYDAASLTMTFTTSTGDLYFNYVFASEEYNEYVGSGFNDAFAFYVDGTNVALLPGTTTPVSINNVNLGKNSTSYINNSPGTTDTQYDGLTTVLTAAALGIGAGTHTIKMVISDIGDSILDSGVFIQGGSFSGTPTPTSVPELSSASGMAALTLLFGGLLVVGGRRKRRQSGLLV